jgi:hypothetical protein
LSGSETGDLLSQREELFVHFSFPEGVARQETVEPETIDVTLRGIERKAWLRFEYLCETREHKQPVQKILDIINDYNQKADSGNALSHRA